MKKLLAVCAFTLSVFPCASSLQAQGRDSLQSRDENDMMAILNKESDHIPAAIYTAATFKSTRIANGHSIEQVGAGVLDMRINHRFGLLNQAFKNFFGLDNVVSHLGFDYGITDRLMIGVGRSTYLKDYDGFLKVKILRQTEDGRMPVSLSYMGALSIQAQDAYAPAGKSYMFKDKMAYIHQVLIARKFSASFSLQLMPVYIHYNLVAFNNEPNDIFALGFGGRLKLSKRISVTGEYYPLIGKKLNGTRNAASVGVDIETGGHVFQLLFTNATGINERTVIGQTTGRIDRGDIHFGFNISRVFTIVRPKDTRDLHNKIW